MIRLLEEWPTIKAPRVTEILRTDHGYAGSVDLVRRRLQRLRPLSVRPRPADRLSPRLRPVKLEDLAPNA